MSQRFQLIQDQDDDNSSIQRHLRVAALLVIAPVAAVVVLSLFFGLSIVRQRAIDANEQRVAAMTRETMISRGTLPFSAVQSTVRHRTTVSRESDLFDGPSFRDTRIGKVLSGQTVTVVGQNAAGNWLQLENGLWVSSRFVADVPSDLPVTAP